MGAIYVYGAAVYAVGQHHVTGGVTIRDCYATAWWRAKTLSLLALLAFLALVVLGQVIVGIVVPPVLFIAWTLLYYDMRVRKEEYDVAALSRELGIAAT